MKSHPESELSPPMVEEVEKVAARAFPSSTELDKARRLTISRLSFAGEIADRGEGHLVEAIEELCWPALANLPNSLEFEVALESAEEEYRLTARWLRGTRLALLRARREAWRG